MILNKAISSKTLLFKALSFNFQHIRFTGKLITKFPSGIMALNTMLSGTSKKQLARILTFNNIYFQKLNFNQDKDFQLIDLVKKETYVNPKIAQHILAIALPNYHLSTDKLLKILPKINIYNTNPNASWDVIIAAIAANEVYAESILFKDAKCTTIAESGKQKFIGNTKEYQDTKQPNPDYFYQQLLWNRFRDHKTGKFEMNTGSNIYVESDEKYKECIEYILLGQKTSYKITCPILSKYIEILLKDPKLTLVEKYDKYLLYLKQNLHKFPDINPTIVCKIEIPYDHAQQKPFENLSPIIKNDDCLANINNSEETIAKALFVGGKTCVNNYKQHFGNNPNIVEKIEGYEALFENATAIFNS